PSGSARRKPRSSAAAVRPKYESSSVAFEVYPCRPTTRGTGAAASCPGGRWRVTGRPSTSISTEVPAEPGVAGSVVAEVAVVAAAVEGPSAGAQAARPRATASTTRTTGRRPVVTVRSFSADGPVARAFRGPPGLDPLRLAAVVFHLD